MLASEFIEKLEDLIDIYGDLKIVVSDFDYDEMEWYNEDIQNVGKIPSKDGNVFKIFSIPYSGELPL